MAGPALATWRRKKTLPSQYNFIRWQKQQRIVLELNPIKSGETV
jgi:hypothetical protein